MKEIKDYLHLYAGCPVEFDRYGTLCMGTLTASLFKDFNHGEVELKLILRPLRDMTEDEAIEVFKMVSLLDLSECQFEFGENYTTWINANLNGRVIDSINFLGDNIEMMNNDGTYSPLNPIAPVHKYYLSRHFDLFSLIENGLAIDKTTLK